MMKQLMAIIMGGCLWLTAAQSVAAGPAMGVGLLDPSEIDRAVVLVQGTEAEPGAVTVVLQSNDKDKNKWQAFLDKAAEYHTVPLIRLATGADDKGGWRRPTKKEIVEQAQFLTSLNWHSDSLGVIGFNEPNQAAEWGGKVDPENYAQVLAFTASWFHTEAKKYMVLPAGLDAAAPNGTATMDNLIFLGRMFKSRPELIDKLDGWTAHAYPNPGFTASAYDSGKQGIKSWEYELNLINKFNSGEITDFSQKRWGVYITETGWRVTPATAKRLGQYYDYAMKQVWDDERIRAVTPFIWSAQAGPFKDFSFINSDGSPTPSFEAFKKVKSET